MKTISKNIINSSNDMKTQTSKCHTFSALLINQLSLYMQCSCEFFHLSINYVTIPRSLGVLLYVATHSTKFPKSSPHKIVFSKRMTALQTSRIVNVVGKGGNTPPFLRLPPFLEIQDVPIFHRFLGKTKVLNNSCNQFVYHFYLESILVLKECLQKW